MMRKRRRLVLLSIAGLGLLLVTVAVAIASRHEPTQQLPVLATAPEYALIDQYERPARSGDVAGTVVVASFIYTSCRDICPLLTARMHQLQE
ncbi:MAG TPA: SCO family protein, partial [Chloroflexota bacterium]|nr:SCO family protein [Chloroflexota bacterium]